MQPDLFEDQVTLLAGESVTPSPELIEREHRSVYIQQSLLGVTLLKSAEDIVKQARRSFTQASRVALLYSEEEQQNEVNKALDGIEKVMKHLDRTLSGKV